VQFGFNPLDLILNKSGNNLEIQVNNSTDKITVQNWYLGSAYHTEVFKTADGKQLLDTQVDQLIQAMASFCSENGMTWSQAIQQKPTETQAVWRLLAGGIVRYGDESASAAKSQRCM
jgi:hypothetical protein